MREERSLDEVGRSLRLNLAGGRVRTGVDEADAATADLSFSARFRRELMAMRTRIRQYGGPGEDGTGERQGGNGFRWVESVEIVIDLRRQNDGRSDDNRRCMVSSYIAFSVSNQLN